MGRMDCKHLPVVALLGIGAILTCVQWIAVLNVEETDFTLEYQDRILLEFEEVKQKLDLFNVRLRQLQEKLNLHHSLIHECKCDNGHAEWHQSCSKTVNWCFLCYDGYVLDGQNCVPIANQQ